MIRKIKTRKLHSKEIKPEQIAEEKNTIYQTNTSENNANSKYENFNQFSREQNSDQQNKKMNLPAIILLVVVLSLISGSLGAYFMLITHGSSTTTSDGVTTSTAALNETNSIADAVEKVYDAVVVVEVYNDNQLVSTGTGFVYKKDNGKAYLMTNNHVISGGKTIKVLFTDETELEATIVGSDTYSDIAVLSVKDSDTITSATMGDSSKSKVGDTVFTVGSPEGSDYAGTVTKGVLSAQERLVEVALSNNQTSDYYMQVLQTDAAINPGNSGGPLCNTNGEVIGITNMKLVDDTVEGMGFAIPIEEALKVATILESDGKVTRPYIGISMLDLTNSFYLWQAGIMLPEGVEEGVAVYSVENNSPAEKAGLQKGDIITKLAGKEVENLAEFRYELYKHSPNEEIEVTYLRDGKEQTTKLTLGKSE